MPCIKATCLYLLTELKIPVVLISYIHCSYLSLYGQPKNCKPCIYSALYQYQPQFSSLMVSVFTELYLFWFTLQLQIISCPIIWFKTLLHGPYWKKTPWTTKHNFFFNYHVTSEYNNLIPCNTVFLENFSNYFCVHCYQTRVSVLLLVTDMYQYPHPLILFHLFTQVTFFSIVYCT